MGGLNSYDISYRFDVNCITFKNWLGYIDIAGWAISLSPPNLRLWPTIWSVLRLLSAPRITYEYTIIWLWYTIRLLDLQWCSQGGWISYPPYPENVFCLVWCWCIGTFKIIGQYHWFFYVYTKLPFQSKNCYNDIILIRLINPFICNIQKLQ